jgi:hypothetical protein
MHDDTWKCSLVLALVTVGCGPAGEHAESYESQQSLLTVSPTAVYQINSAATGKCVGIAGNSTANNAAVEARTCNGAVGQNFTLTSVATGYYAIKNTNSLKCLDVTGKSTADGAAVIQYTCNNSATNQQWALTDVTTGVVRLVSRNSGKVMEVNQGATADGTPIVQRTWSGAAYQKFRPFMANGGTVNVSNVVPSVDGYLWAATCSAGAANGLDCPLLPTDGAMCPNPTSTDYNTQGLFRTVTHKVSGTAGTQYTINFEVRGIAGTRCYTGGRKQVAGLSSNPEVSNDGWYAGGQPVTPSKWNTFEIHVSPPVPGSGAISPLNANEDVYYLNAFPYPPITFGLDTYCEAHETFPMRYTASLPVLGGGTINMVFHDSNCLGQQNCGAPNRQLTCANPRSVDLTGMSPRPSSFTQPYLQSNGYYPQWLFFDVKTVTTP